MTYYIGMNSGTSLNGVDAVLCSFGDSGIEVHASVMQPLPKELVDTIRGCNHQGQPLTCHQWGVLDKKLAALFTKAAKALLAKTGFSSSDIHALGCHGQTLWHEPLGEWPFSMQLGDPHVIAERTHITTVADFRRRDVAAGGQGAPLTPAFHGKLFQGCDRPVVVLNLGGIANVTLIEKGGRVLSGFDTGPANVLMDSWMNTHHGLPCDFNGIYAAKDTINESYVDWLLQDDFFSQPPPKSTGTEYFNMAWIEQKEKAYLAQGEGEMGIASYAELSALSVYQAVSSVGFKPEKVMVCGGGAHNDFVMKRLQYHFGVKVENTECLGIAPTLMEPVAFAWFAKQALLGKVVDLTRVTGASHPTPLGVVYPA